MNRKAWVYLYCAWLVALMGALVSLFYGEVLQLEPCRLCWYQRMALFPLALLLGMAAYRADNSLIAYAKVLAGLGGVIALYQVAQIVLPSSGLRSLCGSSCGDSALNLFGFLPFEVLSLVGFSLLYALLSIAAKRLSAHP